MDFHTMSTFINGLNTDGLSLLASSVVDVSQMDGVTNLGIDFTPGMVAPYLTTISASDNIRTFISKMLETFYPFVNGGASVLFAFKFVGFSYKSMLGRFEEALRDFRWVVVGLLIISFLPRAIEMVDALLYGM